MGTGDNGTGAGMSAAEMVAQMRAFVSGTPVVNNAGRKQRGADAACGAKAEDKRQLQKSALFKRAEDAPKVSPVVPTRPVMHDACRNTGMKIVDGRKWRCDCPMGDKPVALFRPGAYATDDEMRERGIPVF